MEDLGEASQVGGCDSRFVHGSQITVGLLQLNIRLFHHAMELSSGALANARQGSSFSMRADRFTVDACDNRTAVGTFDSDG